MKMDISQRQSQWGMGSSCQTREPAKKSITWNLPVGSFGDGRHRVRVLSRERVAAAADFWRLAYPELSGSPHEFVLHPDRYESLVAMEDTWQQDTRNKVYCMALLEEAAGGKVVAATLLTKYELNLQVEFTLVATHPEFRRNDLTDELRRFTRIIALDSGAEYFTSFCETWDDVKQSDCIESGWKIAGIFPGGLIRSNDAGEEYRGCTVRFYKFVNRGERYATTPDEWHLAAEVREVWEAIERVNQKIESAFRARIQKQVLRSYALSP